MFSDIVQVLSETHTIAAVGLTDNPRDPSYEVGTYLQSQGYKVIPVNPRIQMSLGHKAVDSVGNIAEPIDLVHIIAGHNNVPQAIDEAVAAGAKAVWLEPGIDGTEVALRAQQAGLTVIQGKSFRTEHQKRLGEGPM